MSRLPGRRERRALLVRPDQATTRALAGVIVILTFLAALAAGAAEIVAVGSAEWTSSISREATIQIRPRPGRDVEADLERAAETARTEPGIAEARVVSKAESDGLLEPWLGNGAELASLPIPRLVVLTLAPGAGRDLSGLRARVTAEIPAASVDDHGAWIGRLSSLANAMVGIAASLVGLALAASALAVAFATRGVMAGSRDVVEVLSLVGAEDGFVAREFAMRFLTLGLASAGTGALAAAAVFPALGALLGGGEGDGTEMLFGAFRIGWRGYGLMAALALSVGVIAALVSAGSVKRFLRQRSAT
ncbi:MAG: transporter permease [Enterovirga sp.]|nr:transporter permease [Enterovirga sp.]